MVVSVHLQLGPCLCFCYINALPYACPTLKLEPLCGFAAMLQQPRVPPTGQRQAVEIQIKWREVLAQKQAMLKILSQTTGHSPEKLDKVSKLLVCKSAGCKHQAPSWDAGKCLL